MNILEIAVVILLGLALVGVILVLLISRKSGNSQLSGMLASSDSNTTARGEKNKVSAEIEAKLLQDKLAKIKKAKDTKVTLDVKFFRAGLFSVEERATFYKIKTFAPIVCAIVLGIGLFLLGDITLGALGLVLGVALGAQMPQSYIDRKIEKREEDVMYYLPLVIEQIVIGVSGGLDTSPCIKQVLDMAEERKTFNPVTELLRHAFQVAKSGVAFEDAMNETAALQGHTELRLAFKSLAQVAKHGGEITKQLQELADTVSSQRETQIEGVIKRLELKATGPVGLVFFGFMIIFLSGLGAQLMKAFE
jgi:Flp pilus assembly protein TadB